MHALAVALYYAAVLAHYERNPAEVERLASDLIELSTRQILRIGWLEERFSAVGRAALPVTQLKASRGSRTEYEDYRATGAMLARAIFPGTKG